MIIAVWFNAFAEITTAVFILTYMPLYTSKVLRYDVKKTGIYSAFPAIAHVPLKIFLGILFDKMKFVHFYIIQVSLSLSIRTKSCKIIYRGIGRLNQTFVFPSTTGTRSTSLITNCHVLNLSINFGPITITVPTPHFLE